MTDTVMFQERAERRAIQEKLRAHVATDFFRVQSKNHPDRDPYTLEPWAFNNYLHITCDCESGEYRRNKYPLACKHALVVARRLRREGLAYKSLRGKWMLTPKGRQLCLEDSE